jgi:DNA/RNA-binding domain of Phe-tRNA-synthetase-like protein
MYFCHDTEIWQAFPQLVAGAMVVDQIQPGVKVEPHLQPWLERGQERVRRGSESDMPEVAAWRRAYSQMGLKPTQYRSAAEALLRRFRREGELPRLHPLVDFCNAVSLAFALPIAVFDLDQVDSYLEVRRATGDESYLTFNEEIEHPPPGEVIFSDAARQVHARRWTFRQSLRSTIRPETKRVLIVSEGLHETAGKDVCVLIDALTTGLTALWATPAYATILTAEYPKLEF